MDSIGRRFKKVVSTQLDNETINSYYAEKSPLKIIGTYLAEKRLEELKVRRKRSLRQEPYEAFPSLGSGVVGTNEILAKKILKERSSRFVSCSRNLKSSAELGIQRGWEGSQCSYNYVKKGLKNSPSKLLVLVSNLPTNESTIESINKEIFTRRKELIRSYSSEKVDAKMSLYYRKLTKMRSQYQNQLITKCKKLSRKYSYKD